MKSLFIITIVSILMSCQSNQSNSKLDATPTTTVPEPTAPSENQSKFGLSSEIISKINQEMGLGSLLPWENDADAGNTPSWFTTLEYEVQDSKRSIENLNNAIELSIGSKGITGKYVDFFRINVLFMNPKDKSRAKNLYLEKVALLSSLFQIPIPDEVRTALKNESNAKFSIGDFAYEIEEYGAARRTLSLTIR